MDFTIIDKCIILVAKRNSGKSVLLKYLVDCEKENFDKIFVICPTESINHFYTTSGITTDEFVFDDYNEEMINKLIQKMTKANEKKGLEGVKGGRLAAPLKRVLLILDDLIADTNFHSSPSLKKLFARGRHCGISVIFTSQYLHATSPLQRNNCDFILTGQMNKYSLDILLQDFLTHISKKEFIKFYNKETKNYGFVVINNNSTKSDDINEVYGSITAPL